MRQVIKEKHLTDKDGNPAGGHTVFVGGTIVWQDGPLGRGDDRKGPNGAFVEGVLQAARGRLLFYQDSKFRCNHNARAIEKLDDALEILSDRTKERETRQVEGTHAV